MRGKIRIIVVDDSALVRSLLAEIINRQDDMECIGAANDPIAAREMIRERSPDVITLDVEMPRMDGIDFLARLMRLRPMPVVMVSTLTERGAEVTLRALELGAVDFVAKPRVGLASGLNELATQIVDKIRIAATARVRRATSSQQSAVHVSTHMPTYAPVHALTNTSVQPGAPTPSARACSEKIICIGASTGGTEAIREVLTHLPADAPAICITQHMPPGFTSSFAMRLNGLCRMAVKEAVHGERLLPGHVYIAPGGKQFAIARSGASYAASVVDGMPVNRHKPSVAVLFHSAATILGRNAYGIMLTGMGNDGATAMRQMRDAGSYNYVQDEASCIVFGMPREAIAHGAAHEVLPLGQIAPALMARLRQKG